MLRNGLPRYILYTCPKLNVTRVQSATQWTASVHTLHMPKPNVTRVQSATQWTASIHTLHVEPCFFGKLKMCKALRGLNVMHLLPDAGQVIGEERLRNWHAMVFFALAFCEPWFSKFERSFSFFLATLHGFVRICFTPKDLFQNV